jgi:hypothetical protein
MRDKGGPKMWLGLSGITESIRWHIPISNNVEMSYLSI